MLAHLPAFERVLGLPELQAQIERYLTAQDLSRCCQVSRFFHTLWNRTLWSKIKTGHHGLPEFMDKYCQWIESWERTATGAGYAFLDEMDQVRTSCCYLSEVHLSLPVSDPCGFLRHFMGLTEEGVEEGGVELEDEMQNYGPFRLFIPGRVVFLKDDDDDGALTRQWILDQHPPRQFIPEFSHPEDAPLAPGLPNAFLSNRLCTLEITSPRTSLPLLDWLTRAAIEGHLQGLERFKVQSGTQSDWYGRWKITRSCILQFLGACPRLVVYDAPDIEVEGDEPRVLLNVDIATAYPTGPWKASHFQGLLGGPQRKMIPLQELHLGSIDLHLLDEEFEDHYGNAIYIKKDPLMLEFFIHLPRLARLTVNEIDDVMLVRALELAYHPPSSSSLLSTMGSAFPNHLDRDRPFPAFPPCEGSPARFFMDQEPGWLENQQSHGMFYRLEHLRNLDPSDTVRNEPEDYSSGPIERSWARFVTFPWLKLSHLEFSTLGNLPKDFLEILSEQESIRRYLKSLVISLQWGLDGPQDRFSASSISLFLRSCHELREIKVPVTDMVQSRLFTVEESNLWSRPWTSLAGGGGLEERTGCRDKLEVVEFWGVRLDFQNDGSDTENEAFREWMASLKSLRSLTIRGVGIRLEALIDPSFSSSSAPSSSSSSSTREPKESICGQLKELHLFVSDWSTRLKVEQVQHLLRRMPKLRMLTLPGEPFEPETEEWIENCCPRLSPYVGEDDDEDD